MKIEFSTINERNKSSKSTNKILSDIATKLGGTVEDSTNDTNEILGVIRDNIPEEVDLSDYATKTYVDDAIADASEGSSGGPTLKFVNPTDWVTVSKLKNGESIDLVPGIYSFYDWSAYSSSHTEPLLFVCRSGHVVNIERQETPSSSKTTITLDITSSWNNGTFPLTNNTGTTIGIHTYAIIE